MLPTILRQSDFGSYFIKNLTVLQVLAVWFGIIGEISISFKKQNDMKGIEESPIYGNHWFERIILRHASLMTL